MSRFSKLRFLAGSGGIVLATCIAAPVFAQGQSTDSTGLEEIVVTAQHRSEALRDVPIAVSAVTANALKNAGIDATNDLPQIVPSVQFTRSGPSGLFFVRGVGTTNAAAGEEGANAFYVDGVYMGDLSQTINNFNNIDRIEVLKGPQGTLFGRNATGGLVNVITRDPGNDTVAKANVGYANYRTFSAQAYVATPISDELSVDVAATWLDQDKGWGRNLTTDSKAHIQRYWGVRSKAVYQPSNTVKIKLAGDYFHNRDNLGLSWKIKPGTLGTGGFGGVRGFDTTANDDALTNIKNYGLSLTAEIDFDFARLTSISAWRKTDNVSYFDVDGGPLPLIRIDYNSGSETVQQELRLASAGMDPISWQVGVFYLNSRADNDSIFSGAAFTGQGVSHQHILSKLKTDSIAGFGEVTWKVTPTTQLTGGIRYTHDERHFNGAATTYLPGDIPLPPAGQPITKLKYNKVTWRVALRQDLTDDVNVYASVNRGFKAGSYSLQAPTNAPYLPQTIMAYEVGLKSELFDRRLRLNLSGFHYNIDDYQVRSAAVSAPGSSVVLNAATVRVDGVELEYEAMPVQGLRLFGGVTWLKSRFRSFGGVGADYQAPIIYPNPAQCPALLYGTSDPGELLAGPRTGGYLTCFGDASGNRTPLAPKWAASFGASLTVPVHNDGEVRLTGLYSYNDGYYFESDNRWKQTSFSLVNASIEYRPVSQFGIELWGRNLANKWYSVQDLSTSTGVTQALGAPRTYGVRLLFDY